MVDRDYCQQSNLGANVIRDVLDRILGFESYLTQLYVTALPNKSLDASGGSVFRKIIGPAMVE